MKIRIATISLLMSIVANAAPIDFGWPIVRVRSNFEATGFLHTKLRLVRSDSFYHYSGLFTLDGVKDGESYDFTSVGMLQDYRDADNTIQQDYRVLPIKKNVVAIGDMVIDLSGCSLHGHVGGQIKLRSKNSPEILVRVKGPPAYLSNGFVSTPTGEKEFDLLDAVFCTEKEAKNNVCEKNELLTVNFYTDGSLVHSVRMSPRAPVQVNSKNAQPVVAPAASGATVEP